MPVVSCAGRVVSISSVIVSPRGACLGYVVAQKSLADAVALISVNCGVSRGVAGVACHLFSVQNRDKCICMCMCWDTHLGGGVRSLVAVALSAS